MSDFKGTVDCEIIEEVDGVLQSIEIADYKDGMGYVDPYMNPQLLVYAGGVIHKLKKYGELPNVPVTLTIIQPKLTMVGKNAINSFHTDVDFVSRWMDDLESNIIETQDPNAEFIPGDEQCKWCPGKSICPALNEKVGKLFGDVTKQTKPEDMTDEKILELIESAPMIRSFLDAVEEQAMTRMKSGKKIPGLKVIHGRGSKSWNLENKEVEDRLRRMGIPKGQIYKTSILTPTQAVGLKWETKTGEKKKLSERQIKLLEDEYVEKKNGKLKVVLESEKGEAVEFDASPLFEEVNLIPECLRG